MRNARSKSTFRPRSRRRVTGKAGGQAYPVLKSVASSTGDSIYDPEVSAWAKRVNAAGGSVSNKCLEASSSFIKTIKNEPGLRAKIKRLNLFCGSNLDSSLMPLIIDAGPVQDINNNFTSTEYSEKSGIKNSTASGDKYLDTGTDFTDAGISFTNAHMAVNTLGTNTSSSYKEWIGKDHAALGSNKQNGKLQFRWGEHTVYANNPNPQEGACMGFYLGNCSSSQISLRLNNRSLVSENITSNSPSNADLSQNFHIFKRNTAYSAPNDFDQTINFYSIGLSLTDAETKVLYDAVSVFNQAKNRELFEASDIEVWKWANHRIPEVVGDASTHFSSLMVQNASAWMKSIKDNNLRDKIYRANLFLGKDSSNYGYLTALVPLIIDKGHRTDTSNNFIYSDYNLKFGLHGDGATKSLDTGIITRDLVSASENSGHLSVEATSPSLESLSTSSAGCLIGSKESISSSGGIGMSISMSTSKMTTKAWTALAKNVTPSTEGMLTSSIGAKGSRSNFRNYFNGNILNDDSASVKSTSFNSSETGSVISLFALNSKDYGKIGHTSQSIKSYSIGAALTDDEVKNLYNANANVRRTEITSDNMDSEVYDWANMRVPANGGVVTQKQAEAVNDWMLKIKTSSGLREKLKRVNLMAGSNLAAKMVPLISDSGYSKVDKNTNISEDDTVSTGLKAGYGKSIDTSVKLSDFLTSTSGHLSVKNYANLNTLVTGDTFAHGVISSGVKPNLGFTIDSNGVKGYAWDNNSSNAVNYAKTNEASVQTKKTVDTSTFVHPTAGSMPYWGYYNGLTAGGQADVSYTMEENGDLIIEMGATYLLMLGACTSCPGRIAFYKNDQLLFVETATRYLTGKDWVISDLATGDKVKVVPELTPNGHYAFQNTTIKFKQIVPETQNALDGLWTISRTSATASSLYLNDSSVASSTASASGDIAISDDYVSIMGSYSSDGSIQNHHDGASRIGFYSLGLGLTDAEALTLSQAMTAFDTAMRRDLDEEVWDWAYERIPSNGGSISETDINSVNTFMLALKTESGLRESIKRLNIFGGSSLSSAMVPLIKDFGSEVETNYNFTSSDLNQGLNSSGSKYIDTGMKFKDLSTISYGNFHVGLSRKGNSIHGYSNADAMGDGSISLNLTNMPINPTEGQDKFSYSSSTVTSSYSGSAMLIGTAINTSEAKLYKGGSSNSDTGPFDGSSAISSNSFIIFGNQTEAGSLGQFKGRISIYSLGTGLTSGQVSAFNSAVSALEISLKRGDYEATNSDAWKWANVNVPANSGVINQEQVSAVDKFMNSIDNVHNLRESIKRMNLFVGDNLNAALVPVISDLGSSSDVNNNFISSDYISTGPNSGLTGGNGKTLNSQVKASDLGKNYIMSLRSRSGSTFDTSLNAGMMGAEKGLSFKSLGSKLGKLSFFTSSSSGQTISTSKYIQFPAIFKDLPRNYNGCLVNNSGLSASPLDLSINETSCETLENAVSDYSTPNHSIISNSLNQKILNDRLYYDYKSASYKEKSESSQIFGEAAVSFSIDQEEGRNLQGVVAPSENGDQCKGFYSVICSQDDSNVSKLRMYKNGQEMLSTEISNEIPTPEEEIALFGTKNGSVFHSFPSLINIDFYCLGSNAETPDASKNPDVLDDGFLPNEVHNFLIQLDSDLNRKDFQRPNSSKGILGNLSSLTTELDPEVSKWANERVRKAGGELNSEIVLAVDAWMKKVKERSGLRQKLKRVNLFSSVDLAGALVPIIADEGYPVDLNQGTVQFSEEDFVLGRLNAGVSWSHSYSTPKKYLDTGLNPSKANLSWKNLHMSWATSLGKLHGNLMRGQTGFPSAMSVNAGDVIGDSLSNDEVRMGTFAGCGGADPVLESTPQEACENWICTMFGQSRVLNYVKTSTPNYALHFMSMNEQGGQYWTYYDDVNYAWPKHLGSIDKKFREDKNVLLFAEHADQLQKYILIEDIVKYGGMIVPSRHSLTPIKFSDGKYYIIALTDQEFTLSNLTHPSSGTNDVFKEFVSDVYGYGWTPLNFSDIKSQFWDSTRTEGVYDFSRLIKDLKQGHRYDKSIGWVDPNNNEGWGINHYTGSSRLILHNNNQSGATRGLNTYNAFDSDTASKTIVRNINSSDQDISCGNCGFTMVKAPILMKIEVPDTSSYSDAVHKQTWGADMTYYSVGDSMSREDALHMDQAYKTLTNTLDLINYHKNNLAVVG